MKWTQAGL